MILPDGTTHAGRTPAHWRRVALIVAKRTGHNVGLDTATRMAKDAGFSPDRKLREPQPAIPFPRYYRATATRDLRAADAGARKTVARFALKSGHLPMCCCAERIKSKAFVVADRLPAYRLALKSRSADSQR